MTLKGSLSEFFLSFSFSKTRSHRLKHKLLHKVCFSNASNNSSRSFDCSIFVSLLPFPTPFHPSYESSDTSSLFIFLNSFVLVNWFHAYRLKRQQTQLEYRGRTTWTWNPFPGLVCSSRYYVEPLRNKGCALKVIKEAILETFSHSNRYWGCGFYSPIIFSTKKEIYETYLEILK